MATGTKNLTAHQRRVLGIVEDGGAQGVAFESVVREERHEGRFASEVWNTLWSLVKRGLIETDHQRETRMGTYGPYLHVSERYIATSQKEA